MCSLVNHASQPAEESVASIRTLSRVRMPTKIVDNQLDAWLRFSVNLCERVQVQQHVTEAISQLVHDSTEDAALPP